MTQQECAKTSSLLRSIGQRGAILIALLSISLPVPAQTAWMSQQACQQTTNPNYCSSCSVIAIVQALGCAFQGGTCSMDVNFHFAVCMANMTPAPPPSPTPPEEPEACGSGPILSGVRPVSPYKTIDAQGRLGAGRIRAAERSECVTFLDPVPSLQDPKDPSRLKSSSLLATGGTEVKGIAADGVARVVIQIKAQRAGQTYQISLEDGTGASGWLSTVNGTEASPNTSVTVNSIDASGGHWAFAVFHAPVDFSRGGEDDSAASRQVTVNTSEIGGSYTVTCDLVLWRPAVVLVHGLWGEQSNWDTFTPFIDDPRFFVRRVGYSRPVSVTESNPLYSSEILAEVHENALGPKFNARSVLLQIDAYVKEFRRDRHAAAAGVDLIAHSMGGLVARAAVGVPWYISKEQFGRGYFHKLITIGTPHLGTPVARDLLELENGCVSYQLATRGKIALLTAKVGAQSSWVTEGAVGDLAAETSTLSYLRSIARKTPVAMIAGTTNASNVSLMNITSLTNRYLRSTCLHDPLAERLTPAGWAEEFLGQANDAIVPLISQYNGRYGTEVTGIIHSGGTTSLGFTGPDELARRSASNVVQDLVIERLNEPIAELFSGTLPEKGNFMLQP